MLKYSVSNSSSCDLQDFRTRSHHNRTAFDFSRLVTCVVLVSVNSGKSIFTCLDLGVPGECLEMEFSLFYFFLFYLFYLFYLFIFYFVCCSFVLFVLFLNLFLVLLFPSGGF